MLHQPKFKLGGLIKHTVILLWSVPGFMSRIREWRNPFVGFTAGGLSPVTQSDLITRHSREDWERGDHLGSGGIFTSLRLKVWRESRPVRSSNNLHENACASYFSNFMNYSHTEIALKLRLGLQKASEASKIHNTILNFFLQM